MVLLVVVAIGEYLAPRAELQAQRIKMTALSDKVALKTRYGFWSRDENSFINIRQILPDRVLADVSIYQYDDSQRLQRALHVQCLWSSLTQRRAAPPRAQSLSDPSD